MPKNPYSLVLDSNRGRGTVITLYVNYIINKTLYNQAPCALRTYIMATTEATTGFP